MPVSLSLCFWFLSDKGGLVSAAGAAGVGAKVALIEEHLMGGDCLNVGCVPSKVGMIFPPSRASIMDLTPS